MKWLFPALSCMLVACGPEGPTPASPSAEPAPKAVEPTATSSAPGARDRAAKSRKTYLALVDAMASRDATKVRPLYAEDAVKATAGPDGWKEVKGAKIIERETAAMFSVAPDIAWKNVRVFQRDDLVVAEYVVTGTYGRSGKRAGVRGIALHWFDEDGKVKREHVIVDQMTMLIQTGRTEGTAPEPVAFPSSEPSWIPSKNDANEEANVATLRTTWPAKALLARAYEHEDVATGARTKNVPIEDFATEQAWGFGDFVVAEMQMKGADGIAKHVVLVAEHDKGQLRRTSLYANRLEGKWLGVAR